MEEEKFPHLGKPLHPQEEQLGPKVSFRGSRGECRSQFAAGRRERDQRRRPVPPSCTPQPETPSAGAHRVGGLEPRLQRTDPGRELWLDA